MVATALLLAIVHRPDRLTLHPRTAVLSPEVNVMYTLTPAKANRVYLNGKPTSGVVPPDYNLWISGSDKSGRVFGYFTHVYGEPFIVDVEGFTTVRGRFEFLDFAPVGWDDYGRVLGLTGVGNSHMGDPEEPLEHGWLWKDGKMTDLGLAIAI
jgi:hypothetical protein